VAGGLTVSAGEVFRDYIGIGFTHIVPKGLDHILFVVGLFLLSPRLKPLLIQITSFTVAHSVTLALAMLGVISAPASIVEPLIAASIVFIAVENLATNRLSPWRPFVVFGFGLLHGLGFAGVLTEIGLSPAHFASGLIAFNVGVELGSADGGRGLLRAVRRLVFRQELVSHAHYHADVAGDRLRSRSGGSWNAPGWWPDQK
jgi:hydrogenase/urease accessory protein HupE